MCGDREEGFVCGALLYVCVFPRVSWPLLTVEGKPHERDGKREERRRTRTRTRRGGAGDYCLRREEGKKKERKKKKKKRFSL